MKIKFENFKLNEFLTRESVFCGIPAILIQPSHIGTKFTKQNSIFRSSIWDKDGNLLSAGLKKFVNFGENPENFPVPTSLDNTKIVEKIDGSCCIIDYVNNQLSMRTRGMFSYESIENKSDFDHCISKYPTISKWIKNNSNYSLICEITTPNLRIILDYGNEPDFWLIGAVNKNDYSLLKQEQLDELSNILGIKRPSYYTFSSMNSLLDEIQQINGKEGCCLYSKDQQEIHKIKSTWYLALHRMKEALASFDKVVDCWYEQGEPTYQKFQEFITNQFDWELWTQIQGDASRICDGSKGVEQIVAGMQRFVDETLKPLPNRKEQAGKVLSSYGNTNRASFVFKLLDGKTLDISERKKLLYQVLKIR